MRPSAAALQVPASAWFMTPTAKVPEIVAEPATSSLALGEVLPIPTLPELSTAKILPVEPPLLVMAI